MPQPLSIRRRLHRRRGAAGARRRPIVEWLERRDLLAALRDEFSEGALFSGHRSVCNCPICTGQGLAQIESVMVPPARSVR